MALKQYDPKLILITFGPIVITGFAPGTFCKIDQDEDAYSLQVGADGEATRSRTNNNAATIEVSLMQTALANDLLSQQHELDKATPAGAGCLPLMIKDAQGRALYAAQNAWIQRAPSREFGVEATGRTWTLRTDALIPVDGGS